MSTGILSDEDIDRFVAEGFVHLRQVVPAAVVTAGLDVIWGDLGQRPDDPSTWTSPVIRLLPSEARVFQDAYHRSRLWAAFDQLVGVGRWLPRSDLGLFVVRFPHRDDPGDTGWHIDSSYPPDEGFTEDFRQWRVNVASRDRALLLLFLYSDVGADDAPTQIRVGSHLDVPSVLFPAGIDGMTGLQASELAADASASRPITLATGGAGDVYLCHPFLVHAAQPVRSGTPRCIAQPPLALREPLVLDRPDGAYSPVETGIRRGLAGVV